MTWIADGFEVGRHTGDGLMLIAATVAIHYAGTLAIVWLTFHYRRVVERHFNFVFNTALVMAVVVALLAVHIAEVTCWALFYFNRNCFPTFGISLYFSIVTYTTLGYGDVLPDREWRLLAGVEALTAGLMLAWSTAVILGVLTKVYSRRMEQWKQREL
jgi:hypothetical protein